VFTTHTPVAAGNDTFSPDHVREYLRALTQADGLDLDQLMALGLDRPDDAHNRFGMTVLALRASRFSNGVSELHGRVARFMWHHLWPELNEDDTPIEHITNGVHMMSWIAPELDRLYRDHLGDDGLSVDDGTLWRVHQTLRCRLVNQVRTRIAAQRVRHEAPAPSIAAAASLLDPEALTIGFARRFAPYKRATLLLHERERLAALLNDRARPVQILLAGKAHPQNEPGKQLMQEIWRIAHDPIFQGRIILLEGYNIALARFLVQGVDVWLNTPRRPLEASGTSGMKAAANGGLNLSVSDGWWCEGYHGDNGWSFGDDSDSLDPDQQDAADAAELFGLLENQVIPTFYDRDADGVPRRWTAMMKAAVASVIPEFSTARMVDEYASRFYAPCAQRV
ncbi:alpha-glucan family phosphorylase, partial [bacterium]|nr:alpha-glucan family phosphorylase [bacterium]